MFNCQVQPVQGGGRLILDRIGFTVAPGETICILGPSGCGKSTLLNQLAGLGRAPAWQAGSPDTGYLFQEPRLLPWRTVMQNLLLVEPDPDKVISLLQQVGLAEYTGYYPTQISLGMARRVALVRCLLIQPELVLMDEPLASLDLNTADEMLALIRKLIVDDPARSLIYVTHQIDEALALADRIIVMTGSPGRIVLDSRVEQTDRTGLESLLRKKVI
ncbi:ABC transporter ATP-binding protein [Neptuniibacter halophilus]|uniref:ABC transporter ATP-binding protein n=1 Tax=Neptuniibacter halophilus TaxID=651666 RepID=UPI0025747FF8|nr:ATP-binding cassette domain-containing protein [Neptuniibacter halophilus]